MAGTMSPGKAVRRLEEVIGTIVAIAEREEGIARNLRVAANRGDIHPDVRHRAHARADTLLRLASDLRDAVGVPVGRSW